MAREKEDFRANIELLNARFPDYDMLTIQDTMKVLGYSSPNSVKRRLKFVDGKVSKAAVARYMCGT